MIVNFALHEGMVIVTYDQSELSATLRIDDEQSRNRENDLYSAVAQRGIQSLSRSVSSIAENGRAVERND